MECTEQWTSRQQGKRRHLRNHAVRLWRDTARRELPSYCSLGTHKPPKARTYCSLQLQFLPHQHKLRIASCMHWNVARTILRSPSILSGAFNGSHELWSVYGYVAKLKNPNQFFARGFCVEFLGFPAFPWEQCAQSKQNIWAGFRCANWQGWVIKNGILLSHTNNSSWRAGGRETSPNRDLHSGWEQEAPLPFPPSHFALFQCKL